MDNNYLKYLLFYFILSVAGVRTQGQDVIKQVSCFDATLKAQADSIKLSLIKKGFIVVKEATMAMESEYEMPVIVPLAEGTWYQFVFICDRTSKLYELRMYDFEERQVVYQKQYGEGMESNIISYAYIPKSSEYHMIKSVQVNKKKKKDICEYLIIFKKVRRRSN